MAEVELHCADNVNIGVVEAKDHVGLSNAQLSHVVPRFFAGGSHGELEEHNGQVGVVERMAERLEHIG